MRYQLFQSSTHKIIDTKLAKKTWKGSGILASDKVLVLASDGNYYLCDHEIRPGHAFSKTPIEAATWLLINKYELPEDLQPLKAQILI